MLHGDYSKYGESFKAIKRTFERYFKRMETMTDRVMAVAQKMNIRTMAEVERFCGIPPRTLSNMAGGHKPKDATLRKISEALGVTNGYILYGSDESEEISEQQSLLEKSKAKENRAKSDKLRQFVRLLASMDDGDFDTVIEYMMFLKSRKG